MIFKFIDKPFIKVLNGLRRSGKSTLLALLADHIIELGANRDQTIMINFESMQFSSILLSQIPGKPGGCMAG